MLPVFGIQQCMMNETLITVQSILGNISEHGIYFTLPIILKS